MLTVALSNDNKIITEIHSDRQMGLLEHLTPEVDNILYENKLSVNDLGGIAVSLGPGSFTGLRIGMSFAKTLAYSLNIPIVGIPTMKAMAKCAENSFADYICPLIFARVNEVYLSLFTGDLKEKKIDYTFMTVEELLENPIFINNKVTFLGTGAIKHKELIKEKCPKAFILDENYNFPRGCAINSLAYEKFKNEEFDNVASLVPMYIKKPTPVIRKEKGII